MEVAATLCPLVPSVGRAQQEPCWMGPHVHRACGVRGRRVLKVLNSGSLSAAGNELMLLLFVSCSMSVRGSLYGSFQLLWGACG